MNKQQEDVRDELRKRWNAQTDWYSQFEIYSLQGTVTCLAMTNAISAKAILEVACGTGVHSEFIAKNYLQKGSLLVSCDFSDDMVKRAGRRYDQSEFRLNNLVTIDETDYVTEKEKIVTPLGPDEDKSHVFVCLADNMRLPFPDNYFDCYVANLSLMIVPNYKL